MKKGYKTKYMFKGIWTSTSVHFILRIFTVTIPIFILFDSFGSTSALFLTNDYLIQPFDNTFSTYTDMLYYHNFARRSSMTKI